MSTSTVGLPLESMIWRPWTAVMDDAWRVAVRLNKVFVECCSIVAGESAGCHVMRGVCCSANGVRAGRSQRDTVSFAWYARAVMPSAVAMGGLGRRRKSMDSKCRVFCDRSSRDGVGPADESSINKEVRAGRRAARTKRGGRRCQSAIGPPSSAERRPSPCAGRRRSSRAPTRAAEA